MPIYIYIFIPFPSLTPSLFPIESRPFCVLLPPKLVAHLLLITRKEIEMGEEEEEEKEEEGRGKDECRMRDNEKAIK